MLALRLVLRWKRWKGTFTDFCHHVRHHLGIPWGRTTLSFILDLHGVRTPKRRPGRSPDEKALRRQFETFFAGAQWVGDGSLIPIEVLGYRFVFNLELMTDAYSSAYTGFDVRDHEDSQAVVSAFNHSLHTTGDPPLALLLDPQPSNLTPEVYDILGPNLLIPATPGRPENNAMAESFFGTLECELLDRRTLRTLAEARMEVFRYIEGWYNPRRRHSSLGYLSPAKFEAKYWPEAEEELGGQAYLPAYPQGLLAGLASAPLQAAPGPAALPSMPSAPAPKLPAPSR